MSDELLGCPFCTHPEIVGIVRYPGPGAIESFAVMCSKCYITTPDFQSRELVAEYWNTRAVTPTADNAELVERAENWIENFKRDDHAGEHRAYGIIRDLLAALNPANERKD